MWNPRVLETIEKTDVNTDDILLYLLSLYYSLKPTYVPDYVKKTTNILGIVNRDFKEETIQWLVPLFNSNTEEISDDNPDWDWVWIEYRNLFHEIDPKKVGDKQGCLKKMKKFFIENPKIKKSDVIKATNNYLDSFRRGKNNITFLMQADYFIKKAEISRLSQFIESIDYDDKPSSRKNRMMKGIKRRDGQ